jgi:NAD(P)-dependent dehydrogenase (short-subunit alcohol dehydrogenase family)
VNAIAPGYTKTPLLENFLESHPEMFEKMLEMVPMGRVADPSEIATAAAFLASDAASLITGAVLTVDGGYTSW